MPPSEAESCGKAVGVHRCVCVAALIVVRKSRRPTSSGRVGLARNSTLANEKHMVRVIDATASAQPTEGYHHMARLMTCVIASSIARRVWGSA